MDLLHPRLLNRDCMVRVEGEEKAYELAYSEEEGRYLVASRDLKPGEFILEEKPANVAPGFSPPRLVCLGCYKYIDGVDRCSNCGIPMCSSDGKCDFPEHHQSECKFFVDKFGKFPEGSKLDFDAITPLRVMLSATEDREAFFELESHLGRWREEEGEEGFREAHRAAVDSMREWMPEVQEETVLRIFGICYTNDFSVKTDGGRDSDGKPKCCPNTRLCFALVSMCSHDCVPNTWRNILGQKEGFRHLLRARRNIKKGERITINYEDIMLPTLVRRDHLLRGKKFLCLCKRCSDPTEFSTNGSALLCQICKVGAVLPSEENNSNSNSNNNNNNNNNNSNSNSNSNNWTCRNCNDNSVQEKDVRATFTDISSRITALLDSADNCKVSNYEAFLKEKQLLLLHPNNMFVIRVKYSLCAMYGREEGFRAGEMGEKELERKKKLCEEVLEVLNKVDPGISTRRGMVLYELHLPVVMLAQLRYRSGRSDRASTEKEFRRGLLNLKLALEHLKHEPDGTFEKDVYHGAKQSVVPLEEFIAGAFN